jgi:predicted DNA-binding protein with PD1-like motif
MIASEAKLGRIFVLRLEDGDRLPDSLERFAAERGVKSAFCALLGGADGGSLVVGPEDGSAAKIVPMLQAVAGAHEIAAIGTVFPDAAGAPKLHMHAALGRGEDARTGCVRKGVDIWKIAECVVIEITDCPMVRRVDPVFGFEVLTAE